ncbi:MAG: FtsW/RodA/SpoVE family cell cycle protein [Acidobacteria bacterium]|nr:FtsW/RodA/SpoVE family cell cycle protein [Acidobacteriota bacterium]
MTGERRAMAMTADWWFSAATAFLAVSGLFLSGSARAFQEALGGGVPIGIAKSIVHLVIGFVFFVLIMWPDYHHLSGRRAVWLMLGVIAAFLLAALFGPEINGAHRWLHFGPLSFQPSELAKPVLVVALAAALCRSGEEIRTTTGLARPIVIGGFLSALVLAGRDLGTPALLFGAALAMAVAAGARWRHVASLVGASAVLFALFVVIAPYRAERVTGFARAVVFSPAELPEIPYQLRQSILAVGSGGPWGMGIGASSQKRLFLPEPDNDFLFAIVAEELGLWGALIVLALFLVLAWRGLVIAERAPDDLGRLIALGGAWMLSVQGLCHMGVVTGLLPTKGLPLPFLSTGGSSLIASFMLAGLVLNVSMRSRGGAR